MGIGRAGIGSGRGGKEMEGKEGEEERGLSRGGAWPKRPTDFNSS